MSKYLFFVLFISIAGTLSAAELVTIKNATLMDIASNDGDSFRVKISGREINLRLYYVDSPETTYNSKAEVKRIQDQQQHFGLEDPNAVLRFGGQAAEYTKQALSQPFTIYTSYAWAPGRSAGGRFYAFVETADGKDLAYLLITQGLARIHGKTRPAPNGTPSKRILEELGDIQATAMLNHIGIWKETNPDLLADMRRQQRENAREWKEFRNNINNNNLHELRNKPLNLNSATHRQLQLIPGVGPVTARKITAGRPYSSIEDLLKIPGIGPKTVKDIAPYIKVE